MMRNKLIAILGTVAVSAVGLAQKGQDPSDALFRAMDVSRRMNVESIMVRSSYRGSDSMQCKFEQSARGTSKYTVLAPICDQGVVMYDNGRVMKNFIPDEKKLLIHESMRNSAQLAVRQSLAEQNYKFSTKSGEKIAGRATVMIIALPRAAGMPERRYSIDVANSYLLRVETDTRGDRKVLMDTLAVTFPRSIYVSDPERDLVSEVRRVELEGPESVSDLGRIIELVGFRPSVPGELPFGFAMIDKQVDEERGTVAFKISDGLAHATVFQKRAQQKQKSTSPYRREAKGFEFKLMGDLPDPIIARLLDVFVREVLKGLNPLAETGEGADLLDDLQIDEGTLMITLIIEVA